MPGTKTRLRSQWVEGISLCMTWRCKREAKSVCTDVQLSIVVPAMNEARNLARLIPQTWSVVRRLGCSAEIIIVVGPSTDRTIDVAREQGARVIEQQTKGYGGAL